MRVTRYFAISAAAAAVAVAVAAPAAATPEQDFLDFIAANGITWDTSNTQDVIATGHAVCTDWANGADFFKESSELAVATGWNQDQVASFIAASTAAFCPEFEWKFD